jgi:predicted O-methyltransferase YrrM
VKERRVELIDEIYGRGTVLDRDGKPREAFPASLPRAEGEALYKIVRDQKPARTLEVGMAFGVSSLFILKAHLENGTADHTAIDPFQTQWFDGLGMLNVERAGFKECVRLFEQPSYLALANLIAAGETFDFIFIDGNHRFEYTLVDFLLSEKLLSVGGHVVLHDTWMPSVTKVVTFIGYNRADSFALVPKYMKAARSTPAALRHAVARFRRNPYEPKVARFFARKQFFNYAVFRKTAHIEEVEYATRWDEYHAF